MSFTASPIVSPTPNQLFQPLLAGQQQAQQNQLQIQQLDLTAADHEQVGRLAAGLLNIQDPTARAQAYAQGVGVLQSQGLAKYAPPTLPDEGSLRMLVSQSIPAADQYKMGLGQQAAQGAITALSPGGAPPTGAAPGSTSGTAAPAAGGVATTPSATIETPAFNNATAVRDGLIKRGMDPDTATAFAANALHESVANPATGRGDNGNSAGLFQWAGPRLQAYTDTYGHSPDGEPLDQQLDFVMKELGGSESDAAAKIAQAQGPAAKAAAVSQYYLRPKDTQAEMQRRSATALQLQQQIGGGATTATAAPAGGGGTPGSYQVASTAPTAPPGSTAAPSGPPAAPQFTYPNGKVGGAPDAQGGAQYGDGSYGTPPAGRPVPVAAAAPAPAQPSAAQPGQPQGPAATAQAPPTPASVQPTGAPPAVPHLVTPNGQQVPPPPGGVAVLSNGLTPQQWGLVQNELRAASAGGPAAIAAVLEKVPQLAQQNTALNMAAWKAAHPELGKIETAQGSILYNPNTGETVGTIAHAPVPTTPRFTGNSEAVWNPGTKAYEPVTPDNTNLGPHVAGTWGVNNTGQMQFLAGAARPAQGDYQQQEAAYHFDQPIVQAATTAGQASQNNLLQLNELADLINKGQASGPEGPFRKRVAEFMEQHGFSSDAIKSWTGMTSGSDADLLQKLAVATVGASAKADLGSNVGIQSLEMYANANPGMTMLGPANQNVTNMIRVTRALQDDYTRGLQEHFNTNQSSFLHGGGYNEPVSVYNAQWQQRNNPQIGAAAMGILNGDEYGSWASRLGGSVQDATNAMKLAVRIDPNAKINTGHGQELVKDVLSRSGGQ